MIFSDSLATITRQGKAAAIAAGVSGPVIQITGFKIGSASAADGATASFDDTDVSGLVYTGSSSQISYQVIEGGEACLFRVVLDETVGDFDVGQIGLTMAGGTLFAKAVLAKKSAKWKSNPPAVIGNVKTYDLILVLPNIESCIDLTLLRSNTAALPEVATEDNLPDASSAPYPVYLVRNHTELGVPTIAGRRNSAWFHTPLRTVAGQGEGVLALTSAAFHSSVKINMAVYYDGVSKTFKPADPSDETGVKMPVGIRTSSFEITTLGMIKRYAADDVWPGSVLENSWLFVQAGGSAGRPGPTATWAPYAFVLDENRMWVDFDFSRNAWNNQEISDTPPTLGAHRHPNATSALDGFMSKEDYAKLAAPETFVIGTDGIVTSALSGGRVEVKLDTDAIDDYMLGVLVGRLGIHLTHDDSVNKIYIESDLGMGTRDVMTYV